MNENEAETRADKIDPRLKLAGWETNKDIRVRREFPINIGKIRGSGIRDSVLKADYVLEHKNRKLAVVEAKKSSININEGIAQAKIYAEKLKLLKAYSTNGVKIYEINFQINNKGEMFITSEGEVGEFPSPKELLDYYGDQNDWRNKFDEIDIQPFKENTELRYYQEIAINNTLKSISEKKKRILLTLATGSGKTVIAFHICWKLFKSKWNKNYDGSRTPKILFLADRNILADQAFNAFSSFPENALCRFTPEEISKKGSVPTASSIYFTIFQSMSSGPKNNEYFEQYPKDFFDLVIIDECHRGGANDESSWREVMEYFSSAVQIGLTATPKRKVNTNTYKYFGEPVFTYSLKDGIEDGFLTPFKVKAIQTDKDNYLYEEGDVIVQGEIDKEKKYQEKDFNLTIKMPAREIKRVELMLNNINPKQKTLVFCRDIEHAGDIRNIINKLSVNPPVNYCVRVTAEDGVIGETYLRQFQDNEKLLPTILTTSRKLSTGVDARNIRNIVLLRPVSDMVEFKQIIGRGTRLYKDKNYFTIIDFVKASELFSDPEWDGEPEEIENNIKFKRKNKEEENEEKPENEEQDDKENVKKEKIIVQLAEGRELEIKSMITTMLLYDGVTVTPQEFIKKIFNVIKLPRFFSNEEELRKIWSSPITRKELLNKLEENGLARQDLKNVQELIEAENSDLYDVLEYIAFSKKPISRKIRVDNAHDEIFRNLTDNQKDFLNFVLSKYIQDGVDELELEKLSDLITLKYKALYDGEKALGEIGSIKEMFINFQKHLYQ